MWYVLPSDMLTLISLFWNPKEFRHMLTPGTLEHICIYIYIHTPVLTCGSQGLEERITTGSP